MNVLTTTWRQLVRSRLWPVALLLVAALAAIPFLLSRDPAPVPASSAPTGETAKASDGLATPVVDPATPEDRSRRRRVLGARKDPFVPDALKHPRKHKKEKAAVTVARTQPSLTTVKPSSTPAPAPAPVATTPSVPSAPVPATPPKPKKTYAKGALIVRFGDAASGSLDRLVVNKLGALPQETTDEETPLLVYTGLTKNKKKAIFLVDESLEPTGDGTCKPHPSSCETVELARGDTEFFDVVDSETGDVTAQYELDLIDIK
jgi:hypothetical protein